MKALRESDVSRLFQFPHIRLLFVYIRNDNHNKNYEKIYRALSQSMFVEKIERLETLINAYKTFGLSCVFR